MTKGLVRIFSCTISQDLVGFDKPSNSEISQAKKDKGAIFSIKPFIYIWTHPMCLVTKRKKTKYYVLYNYVFWILGAEKDDELEKEKKQRRVLTSVTWLI